jgi:hypothetical protein
MPKPSIDRLPNLCDGLRKEKWSRFKDRLNLIEVHF